MLLVGAFLGIGLLVGIGLGGSVRNLAAVRVRWWRALLVALALQVVPLPEVRGDVGQYLPFSALVLSYLILVVVVARNWRLRGFPTIFLGLVLNIVPIAVNLGMPVLGEAVSAAGGDVADLPTQRGEKHHLATEEDQLVALGDVIPVTWPFQTVVSVGDLMMYSGAALFLAGATLGRPERPLEPGATPSSARRAPRRATRSGTPP